MIAAPTTCNKLPGHFSGNNLRAYYCRTIRRGKVIRRRRTRCGFFNSAVSGCRGWKRRFYTSWASCTALEAFAWNRCHRCPDPRDRVGRGGCDCDTQCQALQFCSWLSSVKSGGRVVNPMADTRAEWAFPAIPGVGSWPPMALGTFFSATVRRPTDASISKIPSETSRIRESHVRMRYPQNPGRTTPPA